MKKRMLTAISKCLVVCTILVMLPVSTVAATTTFTDVPARAYYAAPVYWAVGKNITNGTSATTFSPEQTCTRAQILTFLWRASGSPEPNYYVKRFDDIEYTDYFYAAAYWAANKNLIVCHNKLFEPDTPCTRGDTVEYIWRLAGTPAIGSDALFTDVPAETTLSMAVAWAVLQGITNGTSETTFSPTETCTRGQIMTFLYRAFATEEEKSGVPAEAHTHKYTAKVIKPSCGSFGYTQYICECGDSYPSDDIVPGFNGLCEFTYEVIAPTATEVGYTKASCIRCDEFLTYDYVAPLDDIYHWMDDKLSPDGETIVLDEISIENDRKALVGVTEADVRAYVNAAAPTDSGGQKVGINRVDAEDRANMRTDGLGGWSFSLAYQPEGTLISHSALKKTGSGQNAVEYFLDTMPQIVRGITRGRETKYTSGYVLESFSDTCVECHYKNDSYELTFHDWDISDNAERSVYLNALTYFGGEKMGIAVWSMLDEHLHYRDDHYMISDELAAKYGLKIVDEGTMYPFRVTPTSEFSFPIRADNVKGLKITDGTQTWIIDYPVSTDSISSVKVYIPAK